MLTLSRSVLLGAAAVVAAFGLTAASCSSGGGGEGTGGTSATGGATATGGTQGATGGTPGTGGSSPATGGAATGGAAPATGGAGTGGAHLGGATGTGGSAPATGGTGGASSTPGSCARADLSAAIATYLKGLVAHDPTGVPLDASVRYTENTKEVKIGDGLWKTAGAVKLQRDLLDTVQCTSFSQVVLPEDSKDIVFTQRLKLNGGKIVESEAVITRDGDWNFDAMGYINTKAKTWDVIPADQRTPRDTLITMPKLYWDYFKDNTSTAIPFGDGCTRVEGGKGQPVSCMTGIPKGVTIGDRRFWADEEEGVAAGISIFGGASGLLDVHYFKLTSGTIRQVYAMTTNTKFTGTGWPGGVP